MELQKRLTLYGLTMIVVGGCIGSGIFVAPAQVAREVGNPTLVLLAWALGGTVALLGALTFSELGGMFPKSGGVYVYLKEAFGDLWGFLYGWAILLIINTGALAGLCVVFADYMKLFFPGMSENAKTGIAAVTMLVLTVVNMRGVNVSQGIINFFSTLKLLAILGIIVAGFVFYDPVKVPLDFSLTHDMPPNLGVALLTALIGVFFSTGGWHHASYVSGEALDAKRNVPRAMFFGVLIVTAMYILVNLAYLMLLPMPQIIGSGRVAGDAMTAIAPWGGKAVAVLIALSVFGTISIYTMSAPRIYYAMAADGIFFKQLAYVHPRWRTPVWAMLFQVVWAMAVLLFFGGVFDKIATFITFMDVALMSLAGISIFVFRKRRAEAERPVRAWGYPVVPAIFVLMTAAFAVNTLRERPEQALPGLAIVATGVVAFFLFKRKRSTRA